LEIKEYDFGVGSSGTVAILNRNATSGSGVETFGQMYDQLLHVVISSTSCKERLLREESSFKHKTDAF
jgi:hypothetical protein